MKYKKVVLQCSGKRYCDMFEMSDWKDYDITFICNEISGLIISDVPISKNPWCVFTILKLKGNRERSVNENVRSSQKIIHSIYGQNKRKLNVYSLYLTHS